MKQNSTSYRRRARVVRLALLAGTMLHALPAVAAEANGEDEPAENGDPIIVTGMQLAEPVNAGKSDVPLIETPQAISVINTDLLQLQGTTRIMDALRNVAGMSRSSSYGFFDGYTIRGFDASYGSIFLDGVLAESGTGIAYELSGLEQVEVVKGPASALFGSGSLGGIVNMVSKRPEDAFFVNASVATGSYDLMEASVDANAPLDANGKVLFRLNALWRDVGSYVDYAGQNRIYISPALTFKLGSRTQLTVLGNYQRDHDNPFAPIPAYGTVLPNANGTLPVDFSLTGPGDLQSVYNQRRTSIGYLFDHAFSESIKLHQTLRYTDRSSYYNNWVFSTGYLDSEIIDGVEQGRTIGRYVYGPYQEDNKDFVVDTRINAKLTTGPVAHNLLFGVDYRTSKQDLSSAANYYPDDNPIDGFDPDYTVPYNMEADRLYTYAYASENSQLGFYLQDHLKAGIFTLTMGGRWDRAKVDGELQTAFSPRIGGTVQVKPGMAIYATWSKSFTPQFGSLIVLSGDGEGTATELGQAPPQRGRVIEGGIKFEPEDSTLRGTISVYKLTRFNVLTTDPDYPLYTRPSGEQQSKGIELEGQWRPLPTLSFNLAYAYIDGTYRSDYYIATGTRLGNLPKHSLNLFGSYVIPEGPLKNLGFNANLTYNSNKNGSVYDVAADGGPALLLPGYTLLDAGLSYRTGGWSAQLNVNNIFDKRYYPDAVSLGRVTQGQPRNFRLSLTRSF